MGTGTRRCLRLGHRQVRRCRLSRALHYRRLRRSWLNARRRRNRWGRCACRGRAGRVLARTDRLCSGRVSQGGYHRSGRDLIQDPDDPSDHDHHEAGDDSPERFPILACPGCGRRGALLLLIGLAHFNAQPCLSDKEQFYTTCLGGNVLRPISRSHDSGGKILAHPFAVGLSAVLATVASAPCLASLE